MNKLNENYIINKNSANNNINKYEYIMEFIDAASKNNNLKRNNNPNSKEIKNNKVSDFKEIKNNNINKIEIEENNNNFNININDKENKDNNANNIDNIKKELNHIKEISNNINSKLNQPIVKENNHDEVNNEKIEINDDNIINENKLIEQKNKSLNETKQKDAVKVKINIKKNYLSNNTKKTKGRTKLRQLNSSSDDIFNNNKKYLYLKNTYRNSNYSLNKIRLKSSEQNKSRINQLTERLSNLLNLSTYNSLIKKGQIKKAGLQTSISNLENSIKLFRNNKKKKESRCRKLSDEITKIMSNQSIFKEKLIDYDYLKQKVDNKNKEIQDLKEETNNINLLTKQTQKEINEMNINIQLLNKKITDEFKLCEKMKKEITFYKKHTGNLIQKIKIIYQNSDIIENAIINLEENKN